jgi:hypothetical protein
VVQVQHQGIGALDQDVGGVLVLLQEGELVDDVGLQLAAVLLLMISVYSTSWVLDSTLKRAISSSTS